MLTRKRSTAVVKKKLTNFDHLALSKPKKQIASGLH